MCPEGIVPGMEGSGAVKEEGFMDSKDCMGAAAAYSRMIAHQNQIEMVIRISVV